MNNKNNYETSPTNKNNLFFSWNTTFPPSISNNVLILLSTPSKWCYLIHFNCSSEIICLGPYNYLLLASSLLFTIIYWGIALYHYYRPPMNNICWILGGSFSMTFFNKNHEILPRPRQGPCQDQDRDKNNTNTFNITTKTKT